MASTPHLLIYMHTYIYLSLFEFSPRDYIHNRSSQTACDQGSAWLTCLFKLHTSVIGFVLLVSSAALRFGIATTDGVTPKKDRQINSLGFQENTPPYFTNTSHDDEPYWRKNISNNKEPHNCPPCAFIFVPSASAASAMKHFG